MALFNKNEQQKKIHDHLHFVATVNTVLAVVALVAVLILFVWVLVTRDDAQESTAAQVVPQAVPVQERQAVDAPTEEEIATQYRDDINTLLGDFDFTDSAQAEQLSYAALELYAPRELRSMHLQVVVALQEAQQGKTKEAQQRIEQLRSQYDWFLAK